MPTIIESKSVTINLWEEAGIPGKPYVLLVSTDLQARARVQAAAEGAGLSLAARRPDQDAGAGAPPLVVVLDLDQLEDPAAWLARNPMKGVRVLGFFSHVREEAGAAAGAAGIEVYPRGRFWRQLPDLLTELA